MDNPFLEWKVITFDSVHHPVRQPSQSPRSNHLSHVSHVYGPCACVDVGASFPQTQGAYDHGVDVDVQVVPSDNQCHNDTSLRRSSIRRHIPNGILSIGSYRSRRGMGGESSEWGRWCRYLCRGFCEGHHSSLHWTRRLLRVAPISEGRPPKKGADIVHARVSPLVLPVVTLAGSVVLRHSCSDPETCFRVWPVQQSVSASEPRKWKHKHLSYSNIAAL